MPLVHAYFFGGTISMGAGSGSDPLGAADLTAGLALDGIDVVTHDVRAVGSSSITFDDVLALLTAARSAVLEDGADGIVVVQGTDTLEEVAYLLDLVWDLDAPVVVTGAMRRPILPGHDGPANLTAGVQVAADQGSRGRGSLVVLADEIHAGRFVAKSHASRPHTFTSPGVGPLGGVAEGVVCFHTRAERQAPLQPPTSLPRTVALHTCSLDEDPALLRAVADAASGLVVGAFGVGHVRPDIADVLVETAGRIPVLLCSRTGSGRVHSRTYDGKGNEKDLLARGLLHGGRLRPVQGRLLLSVLLGLGFSRDALREELARHV